uniref:TonB-dependent receptor plug n=1 Tax=Caulobacter sp. (strain K31) TaxID=366602 RepID=B0T8W5_CAUSK
MTLSLLVLAITAALDGAPEVASARAAPTPPVKQTPQQAARADVDPYAVEVDAVEVVAGKPRGSVEGDIKPELTLNPAQIRAYGAGSIAELMAFLEPQLRTSQSRGDGQPVMLINGRRTSGMQEIRDIPPEAIERFEILPEEVSLTYGYRADQRVVNIVLRRRFRALTNEAGLKVATAGDRTSADLQSTFFRVQGDQRWLFNGKISHDTPLFETDRDIVRTPSGQPYDLTGNVAQSQASGPDVLMPVPASAVSGSASLADFTSNAGHPVTDDLTAWRSLAPKNTSASLTGALTRPLGKSSMATISGGFEDTSTLSYMGLPTLRDAGKILPQDQIPVVPADNPFSPLGQDVALYRYADDYVSMLRKVDSQKATVSAAANGRIKEWRWSTTGSYVYSTSETSTGRGLDAAAFMAGVAANDPTLNPFGNIPSNLIARVSPDTAHSTSNTANAEVVLVGNLLQAPAGNVSTTFKAGADTQTQDSRSARFDAQTQGVLVADRDISRTSGNLQASINVPLTSRSKDVLPFLGDLSVNFNGEYEQLSDFGGLSTLGGGANWTPVDPVTFQVSYISEEGAPSASQLNDPILTTANVSIFDFRTNRTVLATRIEGGAPDLLSDSRQVLKLGVNLKPLPKDAKTNLQISANYTATKIDDSTNSFPAITPDIEAAFPDRILRDAGGRLISIDSRPVNYARTDKEEVRWGFNLSRPFGQPRAGFPGFGGPGGPGGGPPPGDRGGGPGPGGGDGGGGFRGGGGGFRNGPRPGQGMFQVSLYHTWKLKDEIEIRDGLPIIDRLNGGSGAGPEHEVQLQVGMFKSGMGLFLNGSWRSGYRLNGASADKDLFFGDQSTFSLNLFADPSSRPDLVRAHPWLRGTRVQLQAQNLFDTRQDVHDRLGVTPQAYQPDYRDPIGRTVRISFRKLIGPARPVQPPGGQRPARVPPLPPAPVQQQSPAR